MAQYSDYSYRSYDNSRQQIEAQLNADAFGPCEAQPVDCVSLCSDKLARGALKRHHRNVIIVRK